MDTKILQAPGLVGIAKIPTGIPNNWALWPLLTWDESPRYSNKATAVLDKHCSQAHCHGWGRKKRQSLQGWIRRLWFLCISCRPTRRPHLKSRQGRREGALSLSLPHPRQQCLRVDSGLARCRMTGHRAVGGCGGGGRTGGAGLDNSAAQHDMFTGQEKRETGQAFFTV